MRWHHGHSLFTGVFFGVMLDTHSVVIGAAGFALGLLAREAYSGVKSAGRFLLHGRYLR